MTALDIREILARLDRIQALPALPIVVNAVLRDINNPHSHAGHIGRLLSHDQALTARILRMANSAFYAPKDYVRNVEQAVVLLGLSTVNAILMKAAVFESFDAAKARPFWLHAIGCACAARAIAKKSGLGRPDEAFVMGLLHDIGKLALAREFPEDYAMTRNLVSHHDMLVKDAEQQIFSCDHSLVGQHLCTRWSLPADFIEAIAYHHQPHKASPIGRNWAACIHLADILARAMMIGNGGDNSIPSIAPCALETLQLTSADFPDLLSKTEEELHTAERFFAMLDT